MNILSCGVSVWPAVRLKLYARKSLGREAILKFDLCISWSGSLDLWLCF